MPDMGERLARVEERVDNIDRRTERMECKISDIHSTVVENKADNKWTKRLVIFMITAILGASITLGFKALGQAEAVAKSEIETVQPK
jgi:hypothetical protein